MEGTVSAAALTHYVRYAESQGVETRALLEQSGLEALTFAESGRRLPVAVFGALLQRLIDAAGDPLFGVRSARHIQPGQYHVLEYMAMSCPTLGEVVERMPRYEPLVGDMGVTSVEPGGERVAVRWHCAFPEPELRRHLVDSVLVSWLGYVRWLTRREVVPVTVRLETDPRRNELAEAYREAWDGDLELDAEDNALVVPRSLLSAPLRSPDAALLRTLEEHAGRRLDALQTTGSWRARVRDAITTGLARDAVTIEEVAASLGLGVRALQRRLAAEGTAFQDQVSLVRRELAEHYLARTSLSLDEIAARLGFDEPRSLSRLFRRWTGLTPGAWRRQMRERSGRMA